MKPRWKRLTAGVLTGGILISAACTTAWAEKSPFSDVNETDWYYSYVAQAHSLGLMDGMGDGMFQPQGQLTREQFVTVLFQMSGAALEDYQGVTVQSVFSDVTDGSWYAPYVAWAYAHQVTSGMGDGSFGVGQPVTREQMAVFLSSFCSLVGEPLPEGETEHFKDADAISSWAVSAVSACQQAGLFEGDQTGRFRPASKTTRAEAAVVFCSLQQRLSQSGDGEPAMLSESEGTSGASADLDNALRRAKDDLSILPFSYAGLVDQLEQDGYSRQEAAYAVGSCGADWYDQAVRAAKNYLSVMPFSYEGLVNQLEYDLFTTDQATYGAENCGADWNQQAVACAERYLSSHSATRETLEQYLLYEKFTQEQTNYAVERSGL